MRRCLRGDKCCAVRRRAREAAAERSDKGTEGTLATVSLSALLCRCSGNERKAGRIADGFNRKINVELRPIQMILCRTLNVSKLFDCCLLEPREIGERYCELLISQEDPEAMFRYVGDLSH